MFPAYGERARIVCHYRNVINVKFIVIVFEVAVFIDIMVINNNIVIAVFIIIIIIIIIIINNNNIINKLTKSGCMPAASTLYDYRSYSTGPAQGPASKVMRNVCVRGRGRDRERGRDRDRERN